MIKNVLLGFVGNFQLLKSKVGNKLVFEYMAWEEFGMGLISTKIE